MPGLQTEVRSVAIASAVLAVCALAVLAYAPGLGGVFVFDSIERVVRNGSLRIDAFDAEQLLGAAYAAQASYPQRGIAYLSLAMNYLLAGQQFDPFAFKLTNLIIHMVNGLLVMILARRVLSQWRRGDLRASGDFSPHQVAVLAVVAMGLWMLHPIQLTSVLYVVQRMTSLSATWVLLGAILFMHTRERFQQNRPLALGFMYMSVVVCAGLGFLCKQTALLLPAYIAVLEYFLFDRRSLAPAQKRALLMFFAIVLVLPVTAGLVFVLTYPELIASGYEYRDFTMLERLMTQGRVLFLYLSLLLVPDIRRFGLFHDDIATSTGILDPATTAAAMAAWALIVLATAWGARRRAPWAFAAAWFIVGHAMESSILPLELVHEHRNYAPSIGLWISVAYYAGIGWQRAGGKRPVVLAAIAVWVFSLALVTHLRAQTWRNPAVMMETLARHHPQSYRAAVAYAFNSIPAHADLSLRFDAFKRAAGLNARTVVPLIEMAKLAIALGQFIDGDGGQVKDSGAAGDALPIAGMSLQLNAERNERVLAALDKAIVQRLSDAPVPTDSVVALIAFVDCALDGGAECVALRDNARLWHEAALSNRRLPAEYEAALELSLAKIYVISADFDAAVLHARRAGELSRNNLSYRLQEAILYATLKRWDDLSRVLEDIAKKFPTRSGADATFRRLKESLHAH